MQVFLPYPSLRRSVEVLDYRRLGKQRVEAVMILRMLTMPERISRWRTHPAVKMWVGYETALTAYYNLCIQEWIKRGYKNNIPRCALPVDTHVTTPPWFGGKIHSNHRLALKYKALRRYMHEGNGDEMLWYGQFDWKEDPYTLYDEVRAGKKFEHYYWPL